MSTFAETDHPRNHPTGRTRFSEKANSAPEGGLGTAPAKPFMFDNDYFNAEQVRPFFAEYSAVRAAIDAEYSAARADLDAAGKYPYTDSFRGQDPSPAGTDDQHEDTAIYLLQRLLELDALAVHKADFIAAGGVDAHVIEPGKTVRGIVVVYGVDSHGASWMEYEDARLVRDRRDRIFITPQGQRNGILIHGPAMVHIDGQQRQPRT